MGIINRQPHSMYGKNRRWNFLASKRNAESAEKFDKQKTAPDNTKNSGM